jgi:hypothetical protein
MKTIILGFSQSSTIFSSIIKWATNSQVNHAYVRLDGNIVCQASGLFVNEQTYESFLSIEVPIKEFSLQITDEQFAAAEKFRLDSLGKPYSVREILGFGWVLLMRRFGKKVANPFKDGDHAYVCSKFAALYAGIPDSDENLTPEDLMEILEK